MGRCTLGGATYQHLEMLTPIGDRLNPIARHGQAIGDLFHRLTGIKPQFQDTARIKLLQAHLGPHKIEGAGGAAQVKAIGGRNLGVQGCCRSDWIHNDAINDAINDRGGAMLPRGDAGWLCLLVENIAQEAHAPFTGAIAP